MVCKELGIEYKTEFLEFGPSGMKGPDYLKLNPNGRIPCIIDHSHNDFVVWESAAVIQYLVDRYDKEHKISFPIGTDEYYLVQQWVAFQISGQGPYFGQAAWFANFHPEKIPSAIDRYQKEIERVVGVLDSALANRKYLVGDKLTIADIAFVPWDMNIAFLLGGSSYDISKYTNFKRWHDEVSTKPAIKAVLDEKAKLTGH